MGLKELIHNPKLVFMTLGHRRLLDWMPDEKYVKMTFQAKLGRKLDLTNPTSLNEKLQWLKLYDHNPLYYQLVDKYAVRQYISEKVGEEYTVPLVGGPWNSFDEIDFEKLPEKFVLKCTHDSGGIVICRDKKTLDKEQAKKKINKSLKHNFYYAYREWSYKNVVPRIIAEAYMVDESGYELKDYKIFCMNGKPIYVEVDFNRAVQHKLNAYSLNWEMLDFCDSSPNDKNANIKRPQRLDDMINIAERLSKDFPFLRVDFYSIYDQIFIGELTLCPGGGLIAFNPMKTDWELGEKLTLPSKKL